MQVFEQRLSCVSQAHDNHRFGDTCHISQDTGALKLKNIFLLALK